MGAGDMPQSPEKCLPNMYETLVSIPTKAPAQAWRHMPVTLFPRRWRQEAEVQGHTWLCSKFEVQKINPLHSRARDNWEGQRHPHWCSQAWASSGLLGSIPDLPSRTQAGVRTRRHLIMDLNGKVC